MVLYSRLKTERLTLRGRPLNYNEKSTERKVRYLYLKYNYRKCICYLHC